MAAIPNVQESQIESRVGRRGLKRGREYFASGAVYSARRQGPTLKALCTGSSPVPYRVQVTFNRHDVIEADCSCPVGRGGYCKHVAALLVAWRERPQDFGEVEELDAALARCSRRELADLIKDLVHLHPELDQAVESHLPAAGVPRTPPDPKVYRRQVVALLERAARTEGADVRRLGEQLAAIKEIGDAFARQREFSSAAVVYLAILCELLAQAQVLAEREPPVAAVVDQCVEALGRCLDDIREEGEARAVILRTLVSLYRFALGADGSARRDVAEIVLARTNAREKRLVSEWLEEMLPSADSRATRRALGGLLLELDPDRLDFDGFARVCRASGRAFDLCWRLVSMGRMEQAVEEARQADTCDLLKLADLLVHHGQAVLAETMVQERAEASGEGPLAQWLDRRRAEDRDRHAALELHEKIFRLQPRFETYARLRSLGRRLGKWDGLHARLLMHLEQAGRHALLVRIHLDENDVDRALALVRSHDDDRMAGLALDAARAAERSHPAEALEIYLLQVERLIAARGRDNYAEACHLLRKVRALMKRTGAAKKWAHYLDDLRERHKTLRALQDELDAAEL